MMGRAEFFRFTDYIPAHGITMSIALLARPKPVPLSSEKPKLNQKLLADLEKVDSLPHLSDTILQAMALVNDPNGTLADMANLIRRDTMLATTVLKVVNSPVYAVSEPVSDLRLAVTRLGYRGCANLIAGIGVRNLYRKHPLAVQTACEVILRHSLFTAVLATAINKVLRLDLNGQEFAAALLHDIGRLVICVKAPDHYMAANVLETHNTENVCGQERKAFGTDHCGVGGLFAIKNNLPKPLGRAMLNHHFPSREVDHPQLVGLVAFTDAMANHIQWHHNVNKFVAASALGYPEMTRKADPDRVRQLRDALPRVAVETVRETRGMLRGISG